MTYLDRLRREEIALWKELKQETEGQSTDSRQRGRRGTWDVVEVRVRERHDRFIRCTTGGLTAGESSAW